MNTMVETKTGNSKQNILVVCIVLFINALFIGKYAARYIPHAFSHALLYVVIVGSVYMLWQKKNWQISSLVISLLTIIIMLAGFLILRYIPVESLHVDRWSVIYSFFTELHNGHYPYGAISNMNNSPGPLPVYFLISYPFYLIHEIGYMPILALGLFVFYMIGKQKREDTDGSFALLLLLLSPFIYWEIVARSTIFFFSLSWLIYSEWLLKKGMNNWVTVLISGIIGGLLLSTRFVYVLLLAIYGIYLLRKKIKLSYLIGWGAIILITFALTILPFYLRFPTEFVSGNPFHTESSSFMPFWFNFLIIPIAIACVYFSKSNSHVVFLSGIALFAIVLIYFLYRIGTDGWINAFYNSSADISYFILPIPFLLGVLSKNIQNKVMNN